MDDCLEDLREAERRFNFAGVVGNIPRPIADFDDEWLRQHCRFIGREIRELMRILHVPPIIRVPGSRRVFTGKEGMLVMLRRLAGLENLYHLSATFDCLPTVISELHKAMLDHVYPYAKRALRLEVWEDELPRLAQELHQQGCLIPTCCGFIVGTIFKIRRPTDGEDAAYNGWKRMHATKYQAVVLANFMIGDYDGPHAGSAGDGNILRRSNVEERLRAMSIRLGSTISVYGDAAYSLSSVIHRPHRGNRGALSLSEAAFNEEMSSFRQTVEWMFGKIKQLWPLVGDKTRRSIMMRQTGKEDVIAALLTNFHTCLCGGVTTDYLGIAPPTLQEYERLISRAGDGTCGWNMRKRRRLRS